MSGTAVLVCGGAGVVPAGGGPASVVVDDLCNSPGAAAQALRDLGATRAVLGLCGESRPSTGLKAALCNAGAEPFGIEAVAVAGAENPHGLLAAAAAKLDGLRGGEPGRPVLASRPLDRRSLFSRGALVDYSPVAVVDERRCVGNARCGLCAEACPAGAIDREGRFPLVDTSACTACAACIVGCPTGAIHLSGVAPEQVAAQLERLLEFCDGVVIACANAEDAAAPDGWALVTLPSLALVTAGWLLQIRARGRQVRLLGCGGSCCAGAAGVEAFAGRISVRAVSDDVPPLQLREPAATVEACAHLSTAAVVEGAESPLGIVELDAGRCTLCGVCALSCPPRALALDESGDRTSLRFDHRACTGCERCVRLCPEDALRVTRAVDPSRLAQGSVLPLAAPHERCTRCGAQLPPAPLRRRLGELLADVTGSELGMCAACARRAGAAASDDPQPEEEPGHGEDES